MTDYSRFEDDIIVNSYHAQSPNRNGDVPLSINDSTIPNKIELLGHNISINGIQPLNTNIKAITEFSTPKNIKDVRSFVGMYSYYRKHIKDFS